jgi:DNA polymerase-4
MTGQLRRIGFVSRLVQKPISELSTIFEIVKALFESIDLENRSIRLLGIFLSNLDNAK